MQKYNMTQLDKDDSFMQMQLQAGISDLSKKTSNQTKYAYGCKVFFMQSSCFPFQVANEQQSSQCIVKAGNASQANLHCD